MFCSVAMLISCGLSKENRTSRKTINGTWELSKISYEGAQGYFKSTLFGDAKAQCFEGSEWYFLANNSTGYYDIPQKDDCFSGKRNIRWAVVDVNGTPSQFQFKFIDEKKKDISGGYGYIFTIRSLTDTAMTISTDVNADGEKVTVVYQFVRKSL